MRARARACISSALVRCDRNTHRYFEKRIFEDAEDVDALCSFACFLQVVRKQDERAALMYSCALKADPQVAL